MSQKNGIEHHDYRKLDRKNTFNIRKLKYAII